ncbi:ABC transporter permease [Microlunatus antarcticus]|jgi:oleandomycin transport system permease protein|uniref:Transport permease protein n=1 Tax=Microlunatus antarcticus TaxID=53388 RepID=A0A7W5JTQ1_9ACTN|nr:ABC transporter permease [Microlunatus antarcticus]MBB3326169.1 oleandomycin transport system permease protein [Microlunatus antarcticus]
MTATPTLTRSSPSADAELPAEPRGGVARYVRHAVVLARRSLIKTWRTPEALIDVTVQPIIFLALFTFIFGGAIAGGDRGAYLQFLLPGILGQSIALAGIALGTNLNTDIEKGVFDRFRSLPIGRSIPLVGAVLADLARYVVLCAITLGTGTLMGFRVQTDGLHALAAMLLAIAFALCFCWISVFVGMIARTSGAVQGIGFLLVLPLSFGSNTFVATETMPGWLQAFVHVNPISHLVSTMRALMTGGPYAHDLVWTLGWMALLLVVFVPLALRAYARRA